MMDSVTGSAARDTVDGTVQRVSGGVHTAIDTAAGAAYRADSGVGEVRSAIRAQPITAALVVFALGYLFGRLGALIPTARR
jgi:hypothetical protein